MTPKLSAYISAWDVLANGFDYVTPLRAALDVFDEVVVAVNTSKDDTLVTLRSFANQIENAGRLRVISTDYAYTDITFDGKIKDAALQACTGDVMVQLDLDEIAVPSQRTLWRDYAAQLLAMPGVDCLMLPSVDLWGDMHTVRADRAIGVKFRLHRPGFRRGVWKAAWRDGGRHIDTSRSDSTELIDAKGDLARGMSVVPEAFLNPQFTAMLNGYPLVLHLGYVSFDQRVRVNKAIWSEHWELRSGHKENVAVDKDALLGYPTIKHHISLT